MSAKRDASTIVVLNRHSSGTQAQIERLPSLLEKHGIACDEIVIADDHKALCRRIGRAVKAKVSRVIVGGGDGTMAAATQYLAHSESTLGLLPFGTGNSFAMTMQIPHDTDAALAIIAQGRVRRVDLGRVNKKYFANFATIGLAAQIGLDTSDALKARFGPIAYAIAGIGTIARHRAFRARLRWGDHRFETKTQQIVVASGRFFGHQPLTPEASVTDGKLSVFLDMGTTPIDVVRTYAAMAIGQQTRLPDAFTLETTELIVKAKPKQHIGIDGDDAGYTPAVFRIEPKALRIFVPEGFADPAP